MGGGGGGNGELSRVRAPAPHYSTRPQPLAAKLCFARQTRRLYPITRKPRVLRPRRLPHVTRDGEVDCGVAWGYRRGAKEDFLYATLHLTGSLYTAGGCEDQGQSGPA